MQQAIRCYKRSRSVASKLDFNDTYRADEWQMLTKIGSIYQSLGQTHCATSYYLDSIQIAHLRGNQHAQAEILQALGTVHHILGYMHHAVVYYSQCASLHRSLGNMENEAYALMRVGNAYDALGDIDEAIETCEQSLAIAQKLGNAACECKALAALGIVYNSLGYAERTKMYGQQSLHIARKIDNRECEQRALECLGTAALSLEMNEQALSCYEQAVVLTRNRDDRAGEGRCLGALGLIALAEGRVQEAIDYYMQALRAFQDIEAVYDTGCIFARIGNAHALLKSYAEAEQALTQARRLFNEVRMYRGHILHMHYAAHLAHQRQDYVLARSYYEQVLLAYDDLQDHYAQARCLLDLASVARQTGDEQEALRSAHFALRLYQERGTPAQFERVQAWIAR
jgi:tetratricopeptide (TPR) repeat protein